MIFQRLIRSFKFKAIVPQELQPNLKTRDVTHCPNHQKSLPFLTVINVLTHHHQSEMKKRKSMINLASTHQNTALDLNLKLFLYNFHVKKTQKKDIVMQAFIEFVQNPQMTQPIVKNLFINCLTNQMSTKSTLASTWPLCREQTLPT